MNSTRTANTAGKNVNFAEIKSWKLEFALMSVSTRLNNLCLLLSIFFTVKLRVLWVWSGIIIILSLAWSRQVFTVQHTCPSVLFNGKKVHINVQFWLRWCWWGGGEVLGSGLNSRHLFHAQEPLQTFKLIIYLRTPCLPCQAVTLLLVPACAPVYIFASHKANHVLIFQIRKANKLPACPLIGRWAMQHWEIIDVLLCGLFGQLRSKNASKTGEKISTVGFASFIWTILVGGVRLQADSKWHRCPMNKTSTV